MIRKAEKTDIPRIMEIWLQTNIRTHAFISADYWWDRSKLVEEMMGGAELYVDEDETVICGFIGLMGNYIAGIFVEGKYQSAGRGKALLDYVKNQKEELFLHVYRKNSNACRFYVREGFVVEKEQIEEDNQEKEYLMRWRG